MRAIYKHWKVTAVSPIYAGSSTRNRMLRYGVWSIVDTTNTRYSYGYRAQISMNKTSRGFFWLPTPAGNRGRYPVRMEMLELEAWPKKKVDKSKKL